VSMHALNAHVGCPANNRPADPKVTSEVAARLQRQTQCYPIVEGNPPLNAMLALLGYMMAYILFTIVKCSPEPMPKEGLILFTSRSEGMLLVCFGL
jgi:hypothetical protein